MKITINKNAGHPWDKRAGFDIMLISAATVDELDAAINDAKRKFWKVWIRGISGSTGTPGAGLYKPSGIRSEWHDSPSNPYRIKFPEEGK